MRPIGTMRCAHVDKNSAPRQPAAAKGTTGRIELLNTAELGHALQDVDSFSHIWVLFWFHRDAKFKPKVTPPRSETKRGVFATRSPHRPNPIGMSLMRLTRIEGHVLHVSDVDLIDGTPIFDIKPYLPYADVAAKAGHGWLDQPVDPRADYAVEFTPVAEAQLKFLEKSGVGFLRERALTSLRLGPAAHPYRRIKKKGKHLQIAIKDFRLRFTCPGRTVTVLSIHSGYKPQVLRKSTAQPTADTPLSVHRAYVEAFGWESVAH